MLADQNSRCNSSLEPKDINRSTPLYKSTLSTHTSMEQQRARDVEGASLRAKTNAFYKSPRWSLLKFSDTIYFLLGFSKLSISFPERTSGFQRLNSLLVCQPSTYYCIRTLQRRPSFDFKFPSLDVRHLSSQPITPPNETRRQCHSSPAPPKANRLAKKT
jgi:hypothetical protein